MIGVVRIAIVGFGLIGGSIARALRRTPGGTPAQEAAVRIWIAAWSRHSTGPEAALADGVIDAAPRTLAETVAGAELVVLAAPPLACLDLLAELADPSAGQLGPAVTLTDVASTKRLLVERADELGLSFVGGHPMAGREEAGYPAAREDLFVDRPWVVCPGAKAAARDLTRVEWLARACGARPVQLGPAEHDAAVASISHLPLVLSASLAQAVSARPDWPTAAGLAASGWRSMTRLAQGDPTMGAGIVATNALELSAGIRAIQGVLDGWLVDLAGPNPDADVLTARLEAARQALGPR